MLIHFLSRIPYFFAAWFLTWATATSPILSRSPNTVISKYNPTRYPIIVNTFFLLVPILLVALLVPLSFIANQGTDKAWYMMIEFRNTLVANAEAFDSGNMIGLVDPRIMVQEYHSALIPVWTQNVKNIQKVWWCWCVFVAFLFIVSTTRFENIVVGILV